MTVLAAIRADSVNFPLFLHVFGAMLLVGTLAAVAFVTVAGWRNPERAAGLARFGLKTLLVGVFPGNVMMAVDASRTRNTPFKAATYARLPLQLPMIRGAWRAGRR